MSIRKILASINGRETRDGVLELAAVLAHRFGAHVDVLLVRTDPQAAFPFLGEPAAAAAIDTMIKDIEKEAAAAAQQGKERFETWRQKNGIGAVDAATGPGVASTEWHEHIGIESDVITRRGRLSDVVVVRQATDDGSGPSDITVEAAVLETGRPAFVVPPGSTSALRRVAIAWNGSGEASRAVAMGLPFLSAADEVSVITVDESAGMSEGAHDLAGYLGWHDIHARVEVAAPEGDTGEVLLDAAARCGADLLVMGAYTHSRLREVIFGGATRHILRHSQIPLLMTH